MQHPFPNSTAPRTPEMLRRAQAVLAVTANAYGLAGEADAALRESPTRARHPVHPENQHAHAHGDTARCALEALG